MEVGRVQDFPHRLVASRSRIVCTGVDGIRKGVN